MRHIVLLTISLLATNSITPMENNDFTKNIIPKFMLINEITTMLPIMIPKEITNIIQASLYHRELYENKLMLTLTKKYNLPSTDNQQKQALIQFYTSRPCHFTSQQQYESFLTLSVTYRRAISNNINHNNHYIFVKIDPTKALQENPNSPIHNATIKSCFKPGELMSPRGTNNITLNTPSHFHHSSTY